MCYGMYCEFESRSTGRCRKPRYEECPASLPSFADADNDDTLEELDEDEESRA